MLADNKLKISNNSENIKILSSDITFYMKGSGVHVISQAGDTLSKLAIDEILKLDPVKNSPTANSTYQKCGRKYKHLQISRSLREKYFHFANAQKHIIFI